MKKNMLKRITVVSIWVLSTSILFSSCTESINEENTQVEANEKIEKMNEEFISDRNDFKEEVRERIEELNSDFLEIEDNLNTETEDLNELTKERYTDMKAKITKEREDLKEILSDIDTRTENNWEEFKSESRVTWERTKAEMKELRREVSETFQSDEKENK